jgi:hypothetical protein
MAGKRLYNNGTGEFVFKRKGRIARSVSLTFDSEKEGDDLAEGQGTAGSRDRSRGIDRESNTQPR